MKPISTSFLDPSEAVDLSNCDREPIHVPGQVQSLGALLVLDAEERLCQRSANAEDLLGRELPLGSTLSALLPSELVAAVQAGIRQELERVVPCVYSGPLSDAVPDADVLVHRSGELSVVELVGVARRPAGARVTLRSNELAGKLRGAGDLSQLCDLFAREVRACFGYDRVMVYRFDPDGHGWVSAEARRGDLEPFLGLHYPAEDIPAQARRLFLRNSVRMIHSIDAAPVPLEPQRLGTEAKPTDLTHAVLRGVSPVHVEYLQNMGVRASLSIAIPRGEDLWGLVACHHYAGPHSLSWQERCALDALAQTMGAKVAQLEAEQKLADRRTGAEHLMEISVLLAEHANVRTGLVECQDLLLRLVGAHGFAALLGDDEPALLQGTTPPSSFLEELSTWLQERQLSGIFATDYLSSCFPLADQHRGTAAGLIALSLGPGRWLLWFRAEQRREVTWAGKPTKELVPGPLGPRLTPRKSFEAWVEQLHGRSLPWTEFEQENAERLLSTLLRVVYRERERIEELGKRLDDRDQTLEHFNLIASHDLREPLRGLNNLVAFLEEDLDPAARESVADHLAQITRLIRRMNMLVEGLLAHSRLGRESFETEPVDLDELVTEVLKDLRTAHPDAQLSIVEPLGELETWSAGVRTLFQNLISNGIKYSVAPAKVEVGRRKDGTGPTYYVRDHGIGIAPADRERVFRMFQRLSLHPESPEGTGTGLAVVRLVAKRLGGRVWVEDAPMQGTQVCIKLNDQSDRGGSP